MSSTINTGWLKDNNGEKFAPKTLASQVVTPEGKSFEEEIQEQLENIDVGIEITKAEYDALGDVVLTDGKTYFITDINSEGGGSGSGSNIAADIIYDNTESGLESNNIQNAIDELNTNLESCFQNVSDGKQRIASAITDMGIETDANETFSEMAAKILAIESGVDTSDATASAAQILKDKTAYVNGEKLTGTMPSNGAVSQALNCGGSYTVPKGYHNGSGKVTANSLASQTSANASAANITSGKTAWVNGVKITGTRPAPVKSETRSGTVSVPNGNGGGLAEVLINFKSAFDRAPSITTVLKSVTGHSQYSGAYDIKNQCTISTRNVTASSFVLVIKNSNSSYGGTGSYSWTAQA